MNRSTFALLAAWALWSIATPAAAATVSFAFNTQFSASGVPPAGPAPWVTATFSDTSTPGQVQLTVTASGLTGSEDLASLYFNIDPALSPTALVFNSLNGGPGTISASGPIGLAEDKYKADGDGLYDILISYPTSTGATFTNGFTSTYDITYGGSGAFSAASFYFLSTPSGGHGPFYAAAHIQNTGPGGLSSAWVAPVSPVPLPAAGWLLFSGLSGAGAVAAALRDRRPARRAGDAVPSPP